MRREAKGDGYWLEIEIDAMAEAGLHARSLILQASGESPTNLTIQLSINVPAENIIVTPKAIDLGEVSLSDLRSGVTIRRRLGIRKQVGSFHIRAISSTLPFLKLESQTMIKDSNYLIKISIDTEKLPKPGSYTGVLRIDTDDSQSPRVEVPVRIVVSGQ